jgi:NAD(P)-dependent dehydrogenase (short-subunit alcohol dehydrogenase family)
MNKSALFTDANKGIGLETARQLWHAGFYVYMGSGLKNNGQEATEKLNLGIIYLCGFQDTAQGGSIQILSCPR